MPCGMFSGVSCSYGGMMCMRERGRERGTASAMDGWLGIGVFLEIPTCNIHTGNVQKEITLLFLEGGSWRRFGLSFWEVRLH